MQNENSSKREYSSGYSEPDGEEFLVELDNASSQCSEDYEIPLCIDYYMCDNCNLWMFRILLELTNSA